MADALLVGASNIRAPIPCTTCDEMIRPDEPFAITWETRPRSEDEMLQKKPDHMEHLRCNLARVPRTAPPPALPAAGAA